MEIHDPIELEARISNVESLRLNLNSGQQCVRDFFVCLEENVVNWPDVYSSFVFKITHSSECLACHHVHQFETSQMYIELSVPVDGSNLNDCVEEYLCTSSLRGYNCEDGCKKFNQFERRSTLSKMKDAEFIIVLLTRTEETLDGYQLNRNRIIATNDIFVR